jgi:hypothetical protein
MREYNHRDPQDLAVLSAELSALTREQKATIWTVAVRTGLFKPLWPIRWAVALNCRIHGVEKGLARTIKVCLGLSGVWEKEWDLLVKFLVSGKNADDPTSAGGFNRRDLNNFLKIAVAAGWKPPE